MDWRLKILVLLLLLTIQTSASQDQPINCSISIAPANPSPHATTVKLRAEHMYESNTNGQSYGPVTRATADMTIPSTGEIQEHPFQNTATDTETFRVVFDGEQVCASILYTSDSEACMEYGCDSSDPTYECQNVCFQANDFGTRRNLNFYFVVKSSLGIGTWTERDYLTIYTVEATERRCYQHDEPYYYNKYVEPQISEVTCPEGQRCRVTIMYVQSTSDARYYIGCEDKSGHADGCEWQGCRFNEREPIPGSSSYYTFHEICRYCCTGDLCNDVRKCRGSNCNLDEVGDGDANNGDHNSGVLFVYFSVYSVLLFSLFVVLFSHFSCPMVISCYSI